MEQRKAIWKYPLEITDKQYVFLPVGYRILSIITQHDIPTLYALVNVSGGLLAKVTIRMAGTGHQHDREIEGWAYLGTILTYSDNLVWHIFQEVTHVPDEEAILARQAIEDDVAEQIEDLQTGGKIR